MKSADSEQTSTKGVLSVLQPFYSGSTSFNGSRALLEQNSNHGKLKGVFRESLGNFDDPMKLFSDFKSERKKAGVQLNYATGALDTSCLFFGTEGDVDSEEQGAAVRIKLEDNKLWQLGSSYTYREGLAAEKNGTLSENHAIALDLRVPFTGELALIAETAHTSDSEKKEDDGYITAIRYDTGNFRFSGGYIDLGQAFDAPFADPVYQISTDARGIDTSLDFTRSAPMYFIQNLAMTLGFVDLKRHSDDQKVREVDTSLRFNIGKRNTFFLSWFGQEEGRDRTDTFRGSAEYKWNDLWSSRLQANHATSNFSRSWRFTLDTAWRQFSHSARLAAEWLKREIDTSRLSPIKETNLRFDYTRELWGLQMQAKHSQNRSESGQNFFGRFEYKPVFYHRYRFVTYLAVGNRAAFSFEEQLEFGMEVRF